MIDNGLCKYFRKIEGLKNLLTCFDDVCVKLYEALKN